MIIQGKQVGHSHLSMTLLENLPLKADLLSLLNHIINLVFLSQDDQLSVDKFVSLISDTLEVSLIVVMRDKVPKHGVLFLHIAEVYSLEDDYH